MLSALDLVIVAAYCLGMVGFGIAFRRYQRDAKTYLLGDHNVPLWLVLISIVATETSTVTFLSVTGLGFDPRAGSFAFLQLAVGYIVGRVLIAWWLVPQYFRGEFFSAYQVLHARFGPVVQRTASAVFLATRTVADGLRLYLAGLFLNGCADVPLELAILAMGLLTLAYTYLGGVQAIFWTDVVQFAIKFGAAVVALVMACWLAPGGAAALWQINAADGRLWWLDFDLDWAQPYTFWAGLFGGLFLTMASHGADQMMVQRYLCSRNVSEARWAVVLSGLVVFVQFAVFLGLGMSLYGLWRLGCFPEAEGVAKDQILAVFLVGYLPMGIKGLVIAAVVAAAMSTLSASWNSAASAVVYDFYQPLVSGQSPAHYLAWARGVTLVAGGLQIAIALLAAPVLREKSLVSAVLAVATFTTGLLLGLFILGSLRRPAGTRAVLSGLAVGLLAVAYAWSAGLAFPWFAPLGTGVVVGVALLVQRALRTV